MTIQVKKTKLYLLKLPNRTLKNLFNSKKNLPKKKKKKKKVNVFVFTGQQVKFLFPFFFNYCRLIIIYLIASAREMWNHARSRSSVPALKIKCI